MGKKSPRILGQKFSLKITKFFEFLGRNFLVADRVPDSVSQVGEKKFVLGKKFMLGNLPPKRYGKLNLENKLESVCGVD